MIKITKILSKKKYFSPLELRKQVPVRRILVLCIGPVEGTFVSRNRFDEHLIKGDHVQGTSVSRSRFDEHLIQGDCVKGTFISRNRFDERLIKGDVILNCSSKPSKARVET